MRKSELVAIKTQEHPNCQVIATPSENPTLISFEVEPAADHPEYSRSLLLVDAIPPQKHRHTTRHLQVVSGTLNLFINGDTPVVVNAGDSRTIQPNDVFYATGDSTEVISTCTPGLTPEDEIPVGRKTSSGGIIVRFHDAKLEFLLAEIKHGYSFFKGKVEEGETIEITALRETREESGLDDLTIVEELGKITRPSTEKNGTTNLKTIHYYLMKSETNIRKTSGDNSQWFSLEAAAQVMPPEEFGFLKDNFIKILDCAANN